MKQKNGVEKKGDMIVWYHTDRLKHFKKQPGGILVPKRVHGTVRKTKTIQLWRKRVQRRALNSGLNWFQDVYGHSNNPGVYPWPAEKHGKTPNVGNANG